MKLQNDEQYLMSTVHPKKFHYILIMIITIVTCIISIRHINMLPQPIKLEIIKLTNSSLPSIKPISTNTSDRVLVIYVYADTHSLSKSNLEYFIRVGVKKTSNVDYYIILQQINDTRVKEEYLPILPSYARYIQHENKCFDLGTVGWFLLNGYININNYKYFIFLNSSVRGPYLVSYYEYDQWYYAFTNRLNNYTKLVGPTINCQSSPHVQSYFWATDKEGLLILMNNKDIFACHRTQVDTIYRAEIPASQVLFNAGFTIGALMKKYQNIDFHKGNNRNCNDHLNPASDKQVDGISLDPFEIVFVKLKASNRDFLHIQARLPAYDKWIQ